MIDYEVQDLLNSINHKELEQVASTLNGGKSFEFRPGKYVGVGATKEFANYHAWLDFESGENWLLRTPRTGFSSVPAELVEYFVISEYATLQFPESTKVPSPKLFKFGPRSNPSNRVGANYLLMEALPGKPYNPWKATSEQRSRVIDQIVDTLEEISHYPFPKAGSLIVETAISKLQRFAATDFTISANTVCLNLPSTSKLS
jgi:hypothetical protein